MQNLVKYFAIRILILKSSLIAALGSSVTLAWDPNQERDIAGYHVYYCEPGSVFTTHLDVGKVTSATVFGLKSFTTYFFVVTAYDTFGRESDFSNEVMYTVNSPLLSASRLANGAFRLNLDGNATEPYLIQASSDLVNWTTLTTNRPVNLIATVTYRPTRNMPTPFFRTLSVVVSSPLLSASRLESGAFQLDLVGLAGGSYEIQVSSNLLDWTTLSTNRVVSPIATVAYPAITNASARFFRTLSVAVNSPVLSVSRRARGAFRLELDGKADEPYLIQASSDLLDWRTLSNRLIGRVESFTYPVITNTPAQFFRAIPLRE